MVCVGWGVRSETVWGQEESPLSDFFPPGQQVAAELSFTGPYDVPRRDTCPSTQSLCDHNNRLLLLNTHHLLSPQNTAYMYVIPWVFTLEPTVCSLQTRKGALGPC